MSLALHWAAEFSALNVFKYITFRALAAVLTSFFVSFFLGPKIIHALKARQGAGQPIRSDGPSTHFVKQGTPTMGGVLILLALLIGTILWVDLENRFIWPVLLITISLGILGGFDDYLKLTKRNSKGLSARLKLFAQVMVAGLTVGWIVFLMPASHATVLTLPFFKNLVIPLGSFYLLFGLLVTVGASNAVNLTDGLDGLAIAPVMITAACFSVIAYVVGHVAFANYLQLPYVPGSGEVAVFCGALVGAGLGFLWYNAPPAMIFMGDTGSLAIGGALGAVSLITKHEIVLAIIGGVFVVEAISVMLQVLSFKTTGKRVFLMAPIHHHFEKRGWAEPTIVIRFWIISILLAMIGMATLKLR